MACFIKRFGRCPPERCSWTPTSSRFHLVVVVWGAPEQACRVSNTEPVFSTREPYLPAPQWHQCTTVCAYVCVSECATSTLQPLWVITHVRVCGQYGAWCSEADFICLLLVRILVPQQIKIKPNDGQHKLSRSCIQKVNVWKTSSLVWRVPLLFWRKTQRCWEKTRFPACFLRVSLFSTLQA